LTSSPTTHRSSALVFLAVLSLTTFAFSQSVYQAIVGNPEFVVLNQITHADLLLIVLCFNLLPAIVLTLLWVGVRAWAPSAAGKFLSFAFLLLLIPFLMELHKRYLSPLLRFEHNSILLFFPVAVTAWIVFRFRAEFARFLLVLSPVVILFPTMFLWRAWSEVSASTSPASNTRASAPPMAAGNHPPIFVLVLDELTRPALLDSSGKIDASRFPHLAELAQSSTWFDNATANAEYTTRSIPVIVTGNFPRGNSPTNAAYPENLFRLLAPNYDITIHEVVTEFCSSPAYRCPDAARVQRDGHLLVAVAKLYLLRVGPKAVTLKLQADDLRQEQARFEQFLDEIGPSSGGKPVFQFMHLELPHAPYLLKADGSIHPESPGGFDPSFAGDTAVLDRLRRNYESQIEFVDREVGQFIARLKQAGMYDPALIVITSDHGVSWKTEAPGRVLSDKNADMIFAVPLFVKLPGQTQARTSSQDAQLIDLTPTIAAVAGVQIPWQTAGHDLLVSGDKAASAQGDAPAKQLAEHPPSPVRQKIMLDASGKQFVYPPEFAETRPQAQ
jgi:hypothetical protein